MQDITTEFGFEQMYMEYFPKIYNYIFYRILSREDTEDLVSEVFFKVAKNAKLYDAGKSGFSTWINTIVRNAVIDYYRKKRLLISLDDEENCLEDVLTVEFDSQLELISSYERRVIYEELSKLKEKERLIIYYKYFEDYTNRQIAEILDMNESTVGTVLSRTLKKLQTREMKRLLT